MKFDAAREVGMFDEIPAIPSILDVVCRATGMGFAAVARVSEDRWIACRVLDNIDFGLEAGGELKVETTLCHDVRQSCNPVVIDNVAEDEVYCGHPTARMYGFQSYISVPIILANGSFFGTLCAIDPKPAQLKKPDILGMFKLFAELIAFHIDSRQRLDESQGNLESERENGKLREEFVAILGHDLRNPLASIRSGLSILSRDPVHQKAEAVAQLMGEAVGRMEGLIENLLAFAQGRLGGGVPLLREVKPIEPIITQVLNEFRLSKPDREFLTNLHPMEDVSCDHGKIAQLLSNLIGNAITHGADRESIVVSAVMNDGMFELSVANRGKPIPAALREHLFQPFYRGRHRAGFRGLGLGLYIAAEIAKAHGGTLDFTSSEAATCFTFRMPAAGEET
jgi:signal transduction histidine kinase